jgi:sulfur carrier protein ThiS
MAAAPYANYCHVTGTYEALIIDLGLNVQPFAVSNELVQVTQRIVTNNFTAKRMLQALQPVAQQHKQELGVRETDVNRRVSRAMRARCAPC